MRRCILFLLCAFVVTGGVTRACASGPVPYFQPSDLIFTTRVQEGDLVSLTGRIVPGPSSWSDSWGSDVESFWIGDNWYPFAKEPLVRVVATPPKEYDVVGVRGRVHWENGKAVLYPADIWAARHSYEWYLAHKEEIERARKENPCPCSTTASASGVATSSLMSEVRPLTPDPRSLTSTLDSSPTSNSKDSLKHLPDGAELHLRDRIVTATLRSNCFATQRADRSDPITVQFGGQLPARGSLVEILGQIATVAGERRIIASSVTGGGSGFPVPTPVFMIQRSVGGGPVCPYTPRIGVYDGLNNTGLMVQVCGRCTWWGWGTYNYWLYYFIDDGSGLTGPDPIEPQNQYAGLLVCDNENMPEIGDYICVAGVSASELLPDGETTRPVLYHPTPYNPPSVGPGNGTISGTVTAAGADGKVVRIACAYGSTTAAISNGTGAYSMQVRAGTYAVEARLPGYATDTKSATVVANQTTVVNFELTPAGRHAVLTVNPPSLPPDGQSTTTITAILYDDEGRRLANEAVTNWQTTAGTFVSTEDATDAVGEAEAVLRSTDYCAMAQVSVTCGGVQGSVVVPFGGTLEIPCVKVMSPLQGQTVSDTVVITASAADMSGIRLVEFYIDGELVGMDDAAPYEWPWMTTETANGQHTLMARALDTDSTETSEGNWGESDPVTVTTDNFIHNFQVEPIDLSTTAAITAELKQESNWTLVVTDEADVQYYTTSGTGSSISTNWTPPSTPGVQYYFTISATPTGGGTVTTSRFSRCRLGSFPPLMREAACWQYTDNPGQNVARAGRANYADNRLRNIGYERVPGTPLGIVNWQAFHDILVYGNYSTRLLYYTGHGSGSALPGATAREVGTWLNNLYFESVRYPGTWCLKWEHPYRFVFLDSCLTGSTPLWPQAFGIPGKVQPGCARAMLGWKILISDAVNTTFTQGFYNRVVDPGWTVRTAAREAGKSVVPNLVEGWHYAIFGDPNLVLAY